MSPPIFIIYYDLGLGGIQRKIVDVVNFLADRQPNLPIYIFLRNKSKFDLRKKIKNKNVEIIDYLDWLKIRIPLFFPIFIFYQTWRLKPKAILAFSELLSLPAIWVKFLFFWRQITVVLSEDRYTSKTISTYRFAKLRHLLVRIFYPFADVIFSPSEVTRDDLIRAYGIPKEKARVIRNWTTFNEEKPSKNKKKYDLIYVGRLDKEKNLLYLLKGLGMIKKHREDIKLCLLGEGEEGEILRDYVKDNSLGKNVEFLGTRYNVGKYLKKARVFILSSKMEGLPLTILEAMASGILVMSSNYSGVGEIIREGETGFIYNNLTEFIDKTLILLRDSNKREKISQQAREYVKKYHSPENISQYLKALGIE